MKAPTTIAGVFMAILQFCGADVEGVDEAPQKLAEVATEPEEPAKDISRWRKVLGEKEFKNLVDIEVPALEKLGLDEYKKDVIRRSEAETEREEEDPNSWIHEYRKRMSEDELWQAEKRRERTKERIRSWDK